MNSTSSTSKTNGVTNGNGIIIAAASQKKSMAEYFRSSDHYRDLKKRADGILTSSSDEHKASSRSTDGECYPTSFPVQVLDMTHFDNNYCTIINT